MSGPALREEILRLALDTTVVVAAFRSTRGASRRIFELLVDRRFLLVATPALFFEYESVLTRDEQVRAHGYSLDQIAYFLNTLAEFTELTRVHFQWKPQLRDPEDEFVLEAAINGYAHAIVTFNTTDFLPAAAGFGIKVLKPGTIIKERFSR